MQLFLDLTFMCNRILVIFDFLQAILHPVQDRVCMPIGEIARLQGFPDYYQLCGSVEEMYLCAELSFVSEIVLYYCYIKLRSDDVKCIVLEKFKVQVGMQNLQSKKKKVGMQNQHI